MDTTFDTTSEAVSEAVSEATPDTAADGDMYFGSDTDSTTSEDERQRLRERIDSTPDPPGTNATRPYWQDNPPFPHLEQHSLAGAVVKAYLIIIGSGMAAVGVAKAFLELMASQGKAPDVVVLDARDICGGATGRSGGNMTFAPHVLHPMYSGLAEPEKMLEFHKNSFQALKELGETYEPADMNMGVREVETVDIFNDSHREVFDEFKENVDVLRREHPQYEVTVLEESEVSKLHANLSACGAIAYKAGLFKPYHFVRGIWDGLLGKYPNLYISANNPVCDIRFYASSSHPYHVSCSNTFLRARHVVHATGGHAPRHLPALRISLTGGSMHGIAGRPSLGFPKCKEKRSWSLFVNHHQHLRVIQLPDNDGESGNWIVENQEVSLGDWDDGREADEEVVTQADEEELTNLQRCMPWTCRPQCGEGEMMLKSWSGIVGVTGDHLPIVGRIPPDYTNRVVTTSGGAAPYEVSDAEDGDNSDLVAPGEWICAGHGPCGISSALLCGQALGIQIAGMEDEVLEKVAGRPGGKLDDWFPREALSLDGDRLERAELSSNV